MSQSETGDCDQATDLPRRLKELAVPGVEGKEHTQESVPTHCVEETTSTKETEAEEVTPDTGTTGNCCAESGARQDDNSESTCEDDTREWEEMGKSKKKGRGGAQAEARRLLQAEPVTFPSTLEGFGYFFDKGNMC